MSERAGRTRGGSRGVAGAFAAGAAVAAGALLTDPPTAGFSGFIFAPLFIVVCLLLAFRRGDAEGRTRPRLWPVLLAAAIAAAVYWWRVMSYRHYGMGGIPLMLIYGVGFWWPGLPVALGSRLADRGLGPMKGRHFLLLVLAGVLGAGLGSGAYEAADEFYYSSRDRLPLEEALVRVRGPDAAVPHGGLVEVEHARPTLSLELSLPGPVERPAESSYEVLEPLYGYLTDARSLLYRHDTDSLRVRVDRGGRRLLSLDMAAADTVRSLTDLTELDRDALPHGGELRLADVAEMVGRALLPYRRLEAEDEPPGFRAEVGDGALTLVYRPEEPVSAETIEQHAAAWTAANRVVGEVLRFFPAVERVRLSYPGLDTLFATGSKETSPEPPLQSSLLPTGKIAVLEVRSVDPEVAFADSSRAATGFRAGRFCPDERSRTPKIALVRVHGPLTDHLLADLFEPVTIGTGELYVEEILADGSATVFVRRWQRETRGPESVAPGDTAEMAGEAILAHGLVDRRAITCHGRPVFGSRRDRREP